MFRKMTVALAAAAALGALAFAPTSASAFGGRGGHGLRVIGGDVVTGVIVTDSCIRQRLVDTPFGLVLRPVNVCLLDF